MIAGPDTLDVQVKGEQWSRRIAVGMHTMRDDGLWLPTDRTLVAQGGGLTCDTMGLRVAMRGAVTILSAKHAELCHRSGKRNERCEPFDPWEVDCCEARPPAALRKPPPDLVCSWELVDAEPSKVTLSEAHAAITAPWPGNLYTRTLTARGVKHDLAIAAEKFARPEYRWRFAAEKGVTLVDEENGDYTIRHDGIPFADVRALSASDAKGSPVALKTWREDDDLCCAVVLTGKEAWPITIDPTTVLQGTTAIEDALMTDAVGGADNNWGANTNFQIGSGGSGRLLVRIAQASIPAAPSLITDVRFLAYCDIATGSPTISTYPITSGSGDWVEGTANGSSQAGSCSWNSRKHGTSTWGTAGTASPTDHSASTDATRSGAFTTSAYNTIASGAAMAATLTSWRTAGSSYGWVFKSSLPTSNNRFISTEGNPSSYPSFQIDYSTGNRRRRLMSRR